MNSRIFEFLYPLSGNLLNIKLDILKYFIQNVTTKRNVPLTLNSIVSEQIIFKNLLNYYSLKKNT